MLKSWKTISVTASLAAILLLGVTTTPNAAQLQNGNASAQTTMVATADTNTTNAVADKPASVKRQKSVLDADVLESPLSFFKDMSGSDEDESDVNVKPSTVVLALKALAATLLSTIM